MLILSLDFSKKDSKPIKSLFSISLWKSFEMQIFVSFASKKNNSKFEVKYEFLPFYIIANTNMLKMGPWWVPMVFFCLLLNEWVLAGSSVHILMICKPIIGLGSCFQNSWGL